MKKSRLLGAMCAITLGALLIASQASAAEVSVIPAETIANVDDPFTLTVQGSDFLDGVSAGSISLTWDPTAMTATSTLADVLATAPAGYSDIFDVSSLVAGQLVVTLATFDAAALPSTFDFISIDFVSNTSAQADIGIAQGPHGLWQDGNLQPIPAVDVTYVGATLKPVPPPVIDDSATVADDADIGDGSTVGAGAVIERGVVIGAGSSIGPNVTINKDVTLGDNAVIGEGSTIHKDVTAGDDLTVGANVVIHKDVMIGARVTIGDNSQIHMATVIGNDVYIGMIGGGVGVFVGNRVTIPSSRVIGDGDVIPNDTTVP